MGGKPHKTHKQFIDELDLIYGGKIRPTEEYRTSRTRMGFMCSAGHVFMKMPDSLTTAKSGCGQCWKIKRREPANARMTVQMKRCSMCGETKSFDMFSNSSTPDGKASFCKKCNSTPERKIRAKLWTYGMTVSEYEGILSKQGNRCAISGKPFGTTVNIDTPVIDHDHINGHVRGIIQARFNLAEGALRTPKNVLALYNYMIKSDIFYSVIKN